MTDDDLADLTFTDRSITPRLVPRNLKRPKAMASLHDYHVALAAQPTADVTVTISSADNGAVGVRTDDTVVVRG